MGTHETNEELIRQYKAEKQKGNNDKAESIMRRIIDNIMPMICRRIQSFSVEKITLSKEDEEDLKQETIIALMEAVEKYDESKAKFITYAYDMIEFAIKDWIEKSYRIIYIPHLKHRDCSLYRQIIEDYKKNNNKIPSDSYIQKMMGVDDNTYRDIKAAYATYSVRSLDEKIEQDENATTLGDTIPDDKDYYKENLSQEDKKKLLMAVISLKNQQERQVMIDYYYNERKLVDIAGNLGVSPQRVTTIHKNALEHLAQKTEVKNLAEILGIKPLDY